MKMRQIVLFAPKIVFFALFGEENEDFCWNFCIVGRKNRYFSRKHEIVAIKSRVFDNKSSFPRNFGLKISLLLTID